MSEKNVPARNAPVVVGMGDYQNPEISKPESMNRLNPRDGVGMHQNPHFQLKPITNWKIQKIRIRSTIAIPDAVSGIRHQVSAISYQLSGIR